MDLLPNEILLKVLSSLKVAQLLCIEDVCRRWKQMIQVAYWNRLEWITKETIDHPDGDYVKNFIKLSHRVVQVKRFIDPFPLIEDLWPSDAELEAELRKATLRLSKKLSSEAAFPLGLVGSVFSSLKIAAGIYTAKYEFHARSRILVSELTNRIVRKYGLFGFNSLHLDQMLIHSKDDDPFFVDLGRYCPHEIPISPDLTQLCIDCVSIRLHYEELEDDEHCTQAYQICCCLSKYKRLESIEIARVHFYACAYYNEPPYYEVTLEFHPDRRQFSFSEFHAMINDFERLGMRRSHLSVLDKVDKWFKDGRVKRSEMHVRTEFFSEMERHLSHGGDEAWFVNWFNATMAQLPLSCVDTLQLTRDAIVSSVSWENAFGAIKANGVLSRVKSLIISLMYCYSKPCFCDELSLVAFSSTEVVMEAQALLPAFKDSLLSLESLTLQFPAKGSHCLSAMFSVTDVAIPNGPLPRLTNLECTGVPCLPFIVSVVSQAPNLRRLSIESKPFQDDSLAIEWINTLLDSVDVCPRLKSLRISAIKKDDGCDDSDDDDDVGQCPLRGRRYRKTRKQRVATLNAKLVALSERSNLRHVDVLVDSLQYSFFLDKERQRTKRVMEYA